jgi:hypothetical protein
VLLWNALEKGSSWEGELVNQHSGRGRYVYYARVTPIHQPDGRITHCLTILEDITERQRNATELDRHRHHLEEMVTERTQQLQQANRILSERAAEIADLYNRAPCGYHSLDGDGRFSRDQRYRARMAGLYTRGIARRPHRRQCDCRT